MSQKKGFLVITEIYMPTKGGTAVWFDEAYRRLGAEENHIVAADVPGAAEYDSTHPNSIARVSLKRHWWLRPESLAMYAKLFWRTLRLGLTHRFRAVHAGRVLPEGFVAWLVARLTGRRVLIYAHGEEITSWGDGAKYKAMMFTYRRVDKIIVNSDFTRDELLKRGIPESKLRMISPGVSLQRFHRDYEVADLRASVGADQPGTGLIVSVGRLSRRKGFDQVIRSVARLRAKGLDVRYAMIGIGEDQQYLEGIIRDEGIEDYVHMLGHVSMEDLPRWYCAADVMTMPNREINGDNEGFGMVFVEAAACARPVVAGKAGGTGSAVVDGVTGLRVDGENLDEIVGAFERLLSDPDYARSLGEAGWQRAQQEFSWEAVAEKTRLLDEEMSR